MFSGGIERDQWHEMGNIVTCSWVNKSDNILKDFFFWKNTYRSEYVTWQVALKLFLKKLFLFVQ